MEKETSDLPEDLETTLASIANKTRFAIAKYLIDNGDKTFTELCKFTGLKTSVLYFHINKLELGGILQNYLQKKENTSEYSFYKITKYGKYIIEKIIAMHNEFYSK